MKRFTETNKWRDPWYRKLTSPAKQLWEYLRDNCDAIGLVELDLALVSGDCGQPVKEQHIAELGDRLQSLGDNRYFLPKFIYFQYGELSATCPPHRTIIKLIEAHFLVRVGLHYSYPNARVALPYKTRQDKNGQEEGRGVGKEDQPTTRFKKPTEAELQLYSQKIGLPQAEVEKFQNHYDSNGWKVGKNPMQSWLASMRNWKRNYEERKYDNGTKISGRNSENPRNVGIVRGPTDYAAIAIAKQERQRQEAVARQVAENQGASPTTGTA